MSGTATTSPAASSAHPIRLAVAVPLANEEDIIEQFLGRVTAQLGPTDRVFCVLDGVCRDRTRERVTEYGRRDPRVVLVWAPENRCVVDAYFRGYREAVASGAEWILEMDGGFSHEPEQIPQFIRAMEQGYEFAGGSRFVPGGTHTGSLRRWLISWGGTLLANLLLGTRMRDMTSGFECFSRAALAKVLERGVNSRAHFFQTEIRLMMHEVRWTELPIRYTNPSKSVGSSSLRDAFGTLWKLWRGGRRVRGDGK
jgi:dolichol-phosphate mannosyltransferase